MDKRRVPRLSLDLLRSFEAAARHLSFTRASQELFLTQPAVSRAIRTLEEQLGQPLFRRIHRALELTPAGQKLLQATQDAFALIDNTATQMINAQRAISVGTTTALASLWLAPRLPRFNRLHPSIDVRIVAADNKIDLDREGLDLAIPFVAHGAIPPVGERFLDCEFFPVCTPALARDPARPLTSPADLARHVWLDHETIRDGRPWSKWDAWFKSIKMAPLTPVSTLHFSHGDQMVAAALEGNGVAMGARPHLARQLNDGVLLAPFGPNAVMVAGSFFIVTGAQSAGREYVRAFIEWLRSEAHRDEELKLAVHNRRPRTLQSSARAGD
jgi:DNA-binding transcriptional LysR family regulator